MKAFTEERYNYNIVNIDHIGRKVGGLNGVRKVLLVNKIMEGVHMGVVNVWRLCWRKNLFVESPGLR